MNPDQRSFVLGQVFAMSMMATAQRGRLYCEGVSEDDRQKLRATIRGRLECISEEYIETVTDSDHVAVIEDLANYISSTHAKVLRAGRFRIGSAQKVLNLYLKYLWCLREVAMPPHCPFDSIILAAVPACRQVRWTQFDSLGEYERIVRGAKEVAGDLALAEWELRVFNDAMAQQALPADRQRRALPTVTVV